MKTFEGDQLKDDSQYKPKVHRGSLKFCWGVEFHLGVTTQYSFGIFNKKGTSHQIEFDVGSD